jgi:tetratricopeptide (TPR) repeat protein
MKAGWAAQRAKKWADATKEFEAALVDLGGDARAMAELGWSAMNAGDYAKAKIADEAAIRAAEDPKVKAAGLFNLGLVQERLEDKDGALRSFATSLSLRPNQTVGDEAAKLGAKPGAPPPPFCPGKKPICDCLVAQFPDDTATCAPAELKSPVKAWSLYTVKSYKFESTYLVDDHKEMLAELVSTDDHMRTSTTSTIDKLVVKKVGGHDVLWAEVSSDNEQEFMSDTDEDYSSTLETLVTACVVGDAKVKTKCVTAPSKYDKTNGRNQIDADGNAKDGKSTHTAAELAVTLGDDGILSVKLVKGSLDDNNVVGPHKLF